MVTFEKRHVQAMPREAPLVPADPPVIVEDQQFTRNRPITDRGVLTQCLEELAKKIKWALDEDSRTNNRYARRLRLHNMIQRGTNWLYQEFIVYLPISESCWNDLDNETIELYIARTLVAKVDDDQHQWFRIRILFDDFMDGPTKDYMDKLDSGEAWFDIKKMAQQAAENRLLHAPVETAPETKSMQRAQSLRDDTQATKMDTSASTSMSAAVIEPQLITISDDEDDVILIDD